MAATDYEFVESESGRIYLAHKNKSENMMSKDRREIQLYEIISLFHHLLKEYCIKNNTDTLVVTNFGKYVFEAKMRDKEFLIEHNIDDI